MKDKYKYEFQLKLDIRDESVSLYIISSGDSETAQLKFNDFLIDRYNIKHVNPLPSCIKRNISGVRRMRDNIDNISDEEFYDEAYADYMELYSQSFSNEVD